MNAPLAEFIDYEGLRRAVLASFVDYEGFRRALNAVRERRDISLEDLDDLAGLPDRYAAKIFGPKPAKRVGMKSLGDLIGALGVECILIEDAEAWARIEKQKRFKTRDAAHLESVRGDAVHIQLSRGFLRKIGAKGGANSRKNLGKRMRKKLAQRAATARWKRQKQKTKQRIAAHKARKG